MGAKQRSNQRIQHAVNILKHLFSKFKSPLSPTGIAFAATAPPMCPNINRAEGMLGLDIADGKFNCYLISFIDKLMPVVYIVAVLMVIVSGVQYMLAGESADNAKKAKGRIAGIIAGIIFYTLMRAILRFVSGSGLEI